MDGDTQYVFLGNPECPTCSALAGTVSLDSTFRPHPNCKCEIEPVDDGCVNYYDFYQSGDTERYGPNNECFTMVMAIDVLCWNGSSVGQTTLIDFGCSDYGDKIFDVIESEVWNIADELANHCPECNPPLVN